MAFFGQSVGFSGLFGPVNTQSRFQPRIIGLGDSLISASLNAKLTSASLLSLSAADRASINARGEDDAVIPPWKLPEETKTLNQQVREVRALTKFINLRDDDLKAVSGDPDTQATFAIFKALNNLRVLAEYASESATPSASLKRLDEQFQSGLSEVRQYISTAELDKLDLFLGDKEYKTEAAARTGKNVTEFGGTLVTEDPNAALEGLTGTEVFTVSITKENTDTGLDETDDITIDLSQVSGTLSLNNIKDYINTQIEAVTILNDDGDPVPKHLTRFDIHRSSLNVGGESNITRYGLQIDGTIREEVKFTAAVTEPTLYIAAAVKQKDDEFAVTSRLTEINNLSSTLTVDNTTSFAGIDYEASEIKAILDDQEDDLDPELAALRDKFRADAEAAVKKQAEQEALQNGTPLVEEEEVDNSLSLTNVDAENRVNADTTASRVVVDSEGGIYVVGTSEGSFEHQLNVASGEDVFLTKFDNEGNVVFSRLLGVAGDADVYGLAIDSEDNVIIAGKTDSELSTSDVLNTEDAFVTKISKRGDEVFRYQFDTAKNSAAYSVAVDSNNDIFVGGTVSSVSATSTASSNQEALILKLSGSTGSLLDSNVFGTTGDEVVKGIAVDANDNLVVATETGDNAVIYRVNGTDLTNQTDSVDLGDLGGAGSIQGIAIDNANNSVYVAGVTTNATLDASGTATVVGSALGAQEGFVTGLSLTGSTDISASFTSLVSTTGADKIADIVVNDGTVYVAGTAGKALAGETAKGSLDAFAARINGTTGAVEDIEQYGEGLTRHETGGLAFTTQGDSVLEKLGLPTGTIDIDETLDVQTQTSARVGDFFYVTIEGGLDRKPILRPGDDPADLTGIRKKVILEEGDDFEDLKRKIRIAGLSKLKAETAVTSEGKKLTISALDDGVTINLLPGTGDRDLLERLGLTAGKLLPKNEVFDLDTDKEDSDFDPSAPENLGGAFGLGLDGALHLKDKATAKYVLGLMDNAISSVQRAFRSLTFDPLKELLKNGNSATSGPVPQHLQNQLANFQTGLARLQSGAGSPTLSLFV